MSTNDPGKGPPDIANLQETFNKQQAKIAALKELVRKSETAHGKSASSTQEKVKHITQRLSHIKSKARYRQQQQDRSLSELHDDPILEESTHREEGSPSLARASSVPVGYEKPSREVPSSEKMQLLRQQMEQNKIKMAERENSKREIEELVTQLKAKFDSTQQSLERSSELGRSMGDLSMLSDVPVRDKYKSASDLSFTSLNLDKEKIKFLENRVKVLEQQLEAEKEVDVSEREKERIKNLENKILDLEENLKEKECIIEARTQAVSLMTENLSMKGKNTVDMLEDTKQEMVRMQSSFIEAEDVLKSEIQQLKDDLEMKDMKIKNLEEVNDILENARYDLTIKNAELESKIQDVQDYSTKLSELNKLNESLQHRISDLESQKYELVSGEDIDVYKQLNEEYLSQIQTFQDKIKGLEKENDDLKKLAQESQTISTSETTDEQLAEKINSMELTIQSQREENAKLQATIQQLEEEIMDKTVEYNVLNENFLVLQEKVKQRIKSLFSSSTDEEAHIEINKLKNLLAEANKSMIKMKLKSKQLQKQVDSFKKMSDVHQEVTRLSDENEELKQKIAELEEDKGSLQLKLMSGDRDVAPVGETELTEKIQILETTCQNQTTAIALLEEQKIDMTENFQTTKQELETLKVQMKEIDKEETERVTTQIQSTQIEEQFDDYVMEIEELKKEIESYRHTVADLQEHIHTLEQDKIELSKKVDHYIAENIELLDKIEKLNKSSSSAESIEIVEGLTHQEKLEIEEFNKKCQKESGIDHETHETQSVEETGNVVIGEELSDSLTKLREESSELMHKIELFTTERREVLEKMEILTNENHEHLAKINQLNEEKLQLEESYKALQLEKCECEERLVDTAREKTELEASVKEIREHRNKLHEEINTLTKERQSVGVALANQFPSPDTLEACQKGLEKLKNEVDNFRKANDKSSKVNTSKKLAKEAQNTYTQMDALLKEIQNNLENKTEIEVSSVNIDDVQIKYAEYEKLIDELRKELDDKTIEIVAAKENGKKKENEMVDLNKQINLLNERVDKLQKSADNNEGSLKEQFEELEKSRIDLERKFKTSQDEIEILKDLVAEQKKQLIEAYTEHENEMTKKLQQIEECEYKIKSLSSDLTSVQASATNSYETYIQQLEEETSKLKDMLEENNQLLEEQSSELKNKQDTIETLNSQIIDLYKSMEENSNKIIEKEDELLYVQDLLESSKKEYEKVSQENDENKQLIEKLLLELHSQKKDTDKENLREQCGQLQRRIEVLEKENSDLDSKNKDQLDKLKKFAANLKKKVSQCNELEGKLKKLQDSNDLTKETKDDELRTMYEVKIKDFENTIRTYQHEIENIKSVSKDEVNNLISKLNELQSQNQILLTERSVLQANCDRIMRDSQMLNEALDHNKKNQQLLEQLQFQLGEKNKEVENLETKLGKVSADIVLREEEFESKLKTKEQEIAAVKNDAETKNIKIEKCKALIKEKNREIQRLTAERNNILAQSQKDHEVENEDVKRIQEEYNKFKEQHNQTIQKYEMEKISFQETISRLETLHDGIQAKLQEDMGYIESLEMENSKFQERIRKLEECVGNLEERRNSLEKQTDILDAMIQENKDEYEKNEDALICRLNAISKHDEAINQRLQKSQDEKEELLEKIEQMTSEMSEATVKYHQLEKDFDLFRNEKYDILESENQSLHTKLNKANAEMNEMRVQYEEKLSKKHSEIDELENDLSVQLQRIEEEKRNLQNRLERCEDENVELKDELVRAKESANTLEQAKNDIEREMTWVKMQNESMNQDQIELQQLRVQIIQDKTESENLKHQIETLVQNHEMELNELRTQISEMDSMRMQVGQNQTDDQVFIETENKKLKEMLVKKDAAIENYQRENLKLQMAASLQQQQQQQQQQQHQQQQQPNPFTMFAGPSGNFEQQQQPFHHFSQSDENSEIFQLREKLQKMENDCSELQALLQQKEDTISKLTKEFHDLKNEYTHLHANNSELQKLCLERQNETGLLKNEVEKLKHSVQEQAAQQQNQQQSQHVQPLQSFFFNEPNVSSVSNVFEEIVTSRYAENLEGGQGGNSQQKKIEDLQRNVSDLEKYAAELENKLRHLTSLYEETVNQSKEAASRYETLIKRHEEHIRDLETKAKEIEAQKQLERMIIPVDLNSGTIPSLDMFFSAPVEQHSKKDDFITGLQQGDSVADSKDPQPVVEELIVPKKTYLCYPDQDAETLALDLGNEGWGWGSDEAALEEKHQKTTSAQSYAFPDATASLENKVREYQGRVQELELERNRLEEKIVESQVLSGKLKKKLKEYKAKLDQYEKVPRQSSVESNELDLAIQEELKSQVKTLEEKLFEAKKQFEKVNTEKDGLLKRVDVLTSANERMIEMKERQDNEVELHKSKVRELSQQLKQLQDWDQEPGNKIHEKPAESKVATIQSSFQDNNSALLERQVKEAHSELEDLKVDRDELQALLEEERDNLRRAEIQIKDLQEKLISVENERSELNTEEVNSLKKKIENLEIDLQALRSQLSNKETELSNVKLKNQNLQMQLNDYQSTIEQLSKESNAITAQLNDLKSEHQKKLQENSHLTNELQQWVTRNDSLSKEIEEMRSKTQSTADQLNSTHELEEKLQNLTGQLQYKDTEILHFKQRIDDLVREDQTQSLVQEILLKNQEINSLRQDVQSIQSHKEEMETKLTSQLATASRGTNITDKDKQVLQEQVISLERIVKELKAEKESMENELEVLNNHVLSNLDTEEKMKKAVLELDMKNIEISELRNSLETLRQQQQQQPHQHLDQSSQAVPNNPEADLRQHAEKVRELNLQWENIVEQRCSEVAESWRQHLNQRENEFKQMEETLRQEIENLKSIKSEEEKSFEGSPTRESSASTEGQELVNPEVMKQMQAALESQELEIVTLKEQLAIRSAEYARLAAQHDPFGQTTSSVAYDTRSQRRISSASTDQHATTSKSEYDLALYMLHQRDMRCEELTLELVNLLDERDTLQLKLSNTLRQLEEVKRKTGYSESGSESDPAPSSTNSPEKTRTRTTGVGSEESFIRTNENLNAKLTELHSMSHTRDTRQHWEETGQRQLEKIQEDLANIPSEAVSELVGADLSNTNTSAPNVLLNWLWGKTGGNSQQS